MKKVFLLSLFFNLSFLTVSCSVENAVTSSRLSEKTEEKNLFNAGSLSLTSTTDNSITIRIKADLQRELFYKTKATGKDIICRCGRFFKFSRIGTLKPVKRN